MGYDALPKISSRQEMYTELEKAIRNISHEQEKVEEEGGEEREGDSETTPKKYLKALPIESNTILEKIQLEKSMEFIPTTEKSIKVLKLARGNAFTYSYLDMLDSRFWMLYSLDNSPDIKSEIRKLIQKNNSHLDYTWFSSSSLQKISTNYSKTSFSMKFHNMFKNEDIPLSRLSIRLWAEDATNIVNDLFLNPIIGKGACLSNIEMMLSNNPGDFVKTRLSMDGSINISRGTSINQLLEFQQQIIQGHYKPMVEKIESDYSTQYLSTNNGLNIKGDILSIKLKIDIKNIGFFCQSLLKGTNPFRFVGFSNRIDDEHYLLDVLDLHNFGHFDLEVFPDELLINLPKGGCGNSIIRLFTLCQERIDPRAVLRGGDGNALIPT